MLLVQCPTASLFLELWALRVSACDKSLFQTHFEREPVSLGTQKVPLLTLLLNEYTISLLSWS